MSSKVKCRSYKGEIREYCPRERERGENTQVVSSLRIRLCRWLDPEQPTRGRRSSNKRPPHPEMENSWRPPQSAVPVYTHIFLHFLLIRSFDPRWLIQSNPPTTPNLVKSKPGAFVRQRQSACERRFSKIKTQVHVENEREREREHERAKEDFPL